MGLKHRVGHLFRRGNIFYLRWVVEGKVFSKRLVDENGQAITTRKKAQEAQTRLMAPFTVASETEVLEAIVGKLQGRKAELAKAEDQKNPPLSLDEAWEKFVASPSRPDTGPETLEIYEYQFKKFVTWMKEKHGGVKAMRDVTRQTAEEYATKLSSAKLSPNTYNKHLNVLTMVYRVLEEKAKWTINPWERIQRKRLRPQSRRELTIEELKRVCQSAKGELRLLFGVGIYTGLREGDCATLRWAEVDLGRGIIRRVPNKTARRNPKPVIVPIHPVLKGMLLETTREKGTDYVLPKTAATYLNQRHELVRKVQEHFSRCGIKVHKPGTGTNVEESADGKKEQRRAVVEVGFHSLRHTFVSLCRESNAPLAVVESIVGHSNPAMTRHYTHVGELAAGQAVASLPSVMGTELPALANGHDPEGISKKVQALLGTVTASNWREKYAEAITMLSRVAKEPATEAEARGERLVTGSTDQVQPTASA